MKVSKCTATLVAAVMALTVVPTVAVAEIDEEQLREELGELQGALKLQSDVFAAEEAMRQTGEDPTSGLERNLVYDSTRDYLGDGIDIRAVRDCVDPPQDFHGTYSVGIVEYTTRRRGGALGGGSNVPQVELKVDEYADEFMAEHAPPPDYDEKPQVRMVFNVGDNRWGWALGDHWYEQPEMERLILEEFETTQLRITEDDIVDTVCTAVGVFESVLGEADGDISQFLKRQDRIERLDGLERDVEQAVEAVEQLAPDWVDGRAEEAEETFEQPLERVETAAARFREALEREEFDEADEQAEKLEEAFDELRTTRRAFEDADRAVGQLGRRLELRRQNLGLRSEPIVPHGRAVDEQLQNADEAVRRFQEAIGEDIPLSKLEQKEQDAVAELEELESLLKNTEGAYLFGIFIVPLGLGGIVMAGGLYRHLRRRRREEQLELEVHDRVKRYNDRLDELKQRAGRLREQIREMLGGGDASTVHSLLDDEATESVDLVFVLLEHAEEMKLRLTREANRDASSIERMEVIDNFLEGQTIRITPANSEGKTVLDRQLNESYEFDGREIFEQLKRLIDEAEGLIGQVEGEVDEVW